MIVIGETKAKYQSKIHEIHFLIIALAMKFMKFIFICSLLMGNNPNHLN